MDQIKPTKNQRIFVGSMYLSSFTTIPYLVMGFFDLVWMASFITEMPYFIRFHWTQMAKIGIFAIIGLIIAFGTAALDVFVFKPLPDWGWITGLIIAAIFILICFGYTIAGAIYGFKGECKKLLPGKNTLI